MTTTTVSLLVCPSVLLRTFIFPELHLGIITSKIFRKTNICDELDKLGGHSTRQASIDANTLHIRKEMHSLRSRVHAALATHGANGGSGGSNEVVNSSIGNSHTPLLSEASKDRYSEAHLQNTNNVSPPINSSSTPVPYNSTRGNNGTNNGGNLYASTGATVYQALTDEIAQDSMFSPDDHDIIIWLGDLNYRLEERLSIDTAYSMIHSMDLPDLSQHDQLIRERAKGHSFEGFNEGQLVFLPTYQFIPGTADYDRREQGKQRCPAWCDRVLYRVGRGIKSISDAIREDRAKALDRYMNSASSSSISPAAGMMMDESSFRSAAEMFGAGVVSAVQNAYEVISAPFPAEAQQLLMMIASGAFISDLTVDNDNEVGGNDVDERRSDATNDEEDQTRRSIIPLSPTILDNDSSYELVESPRMNPMQQLQGPPSTSKTTGPPSAAKSIGRSKDDSDEDSVALAAAARRSGSGESNKRRQQQLQQLLQDDADIEEDLRTPLTRFEAEDALQGALDPFNTLGDTNKIIQYIQTHLTRERVDLLYYNSCDKVRLSDHLPVHALLQIQYKRFRLDF